MCPDWLVAFYASFVLCSQSKGLVNRDLFPRLGSGYFTVNAHGHGGNHIPVGYKKLNRSELNGTSTRGSA
jgi:hypothetical protein